MGDGVDSIRFAGPRDEMIPLPSQPRMQFDSENILITRGGILPKQSVERPSLVIGNQSVADRRHSVIKIGRRKS